MAYHLAKVRIGFQGITTTELTATSGYQEDGNVRDHGTKVGGEKAGATKDSSVMNDATSIMNANVTTETKAEVNTVAEDVPDNLMLLQ